MVRFEFYTKGLPYGYENLCVDYSRPHKMEDDLKFLQMEDNLKFVWMEDDLNLFKNGRQSQFVDDLIFF